MNVEEILPRDAIPSIDAPAFGTGYFGDPDDDVLVVDADPPRAYPVRILSYHEIVNDEIDGPIAVTWCPICASGVVYDRRIEGRTLTSKVPTSEASGGSKDGIVLSFGVSGKLADDALVMYDRETGSEWKQSSGVCIAGELEGAKLDVLPATFTTWARFRTDHPDGVTLQPAPGRDAAEYRMEPYERYADADGFGVGVMRGTGPGREWDREDIGAKTTVLGVEIGDDAVGYPRPVVEREGGVVADTVGGHEIVVLAAPDGFAAFEDPGYHFERTAEGFAADGTRWDGTTGESDDGRMLDRVPARQLYAFAWQDDHGPDALYGI
jgi:hypothetical protein